MKNLNVKSASIAAGIAYLLGVSAFLASFFVPVMSNPEAQANLVLGIAIIPAAMLGARFYYRRKHETNGFILGAFMFLVVIALDAMITVPLFVIPAGGSHLEFFTDPGFWIIGLEYILAVAFYWRMQKATRNKTATHSLTSHPSTH